MSDIAAIVAALGGLGGLGALITGIATLIKTRSVKSDTDQLTPDHGRSIADKVSRIDASMCVLSQRVDDMAEIVRSVGHQVGEIRRDSADSHSDYDRRLVRHDERISHLEHHGRRD